MPVFKIIAFDADDTLWQNERLYLQAQARLRSLLARYLADDQMDARLYEMEKRNLVHFGFGIKAFALAMIETAIDLTDGRISAREIGNIIDAAREMLTTDVELLDHVEECLAALADHALMLITKGDLRDQETKLAGSGLAHHFRYVEIVSDKNAATYRAVLARHDIPRGQFLMIGNSLRSDILPVLEIGSNAVYVPQDFTWAHEAAELPAAATPGYHRLEHLGELPALVSRLETQPAATA